jgi:hypothetical protein
MRKSVAGQTAGGEILRVSQSTGNAGLAKLTETRASSPEEVKAVAIDLGSKPTWESYLQELLDLPRGLMRSALDPEGLLKLQKFGAGEPMINVS